MNFVTDKPVSTGDVESGKKKGKDELGYQHTLMYGRYTTDLSHYAREETKRLKLLERRRRREEKLRRKEYRAQYRSHYYRLLSKGFSYVWKKTFSKFGEDWVFLAMLGILMAIISFCMDWGIGVCNKARIWLFTDLDYNVFAQYIAWIILPILLIWFSAGFVHLIAPQAIGSGIPEMKTILRGVTLKEYLTFKTLFAKVIGLTASLGSGLPLGKEGPFVHIASMVATLLSKLQSFHGIYENESRSVEMLAAASAVGVACCFAAPIGGVLFSIEVTAVYFAVRNYWRGFFAAAFGALFFRLLAVWFQGHDTIKPVFQTVLGSQFPFDPLELIVFSLIGVASGLLGALFVLCHRKYVLWMRGNKRLNAFLQKNRFIYPFLVTWFVMSANFPLGFGQFIAGHLTTHDQVVTMFSNFSWCLDNFTVEQISIVDHWRSPYTGVFTNLSLFVICTFFLSILASTVPVPSGNFVPVFKMGAALGRLFGEAMYLWFPQGVTFSGDQWPVVPGGYAVVGAAAVSGAVTRTISIAVIVSEMTGQITYIVPVVVAVLIANAVAGLLQPSLFDSISMIKKLPYLPDFIPSSSAGAYDVTVNDFMVSDVVSIWYGMSYKELKALLSSHKHLTSFPLVENTDNMILLGSIQRVHLVKAIERHIGRERRIQAAAKWHREVLERQEEELKKKHSTPEHSQQGRRPSRFEVFPVPTIISEQPAQTDSIISLPKDGVQENGHGSIGKIGDTLPRKSILKKTNSFSLHNFGQFPSPFQANYMTVTGAESRIRNAFHLIFQKSSTLPDASPDGEGPSEDSNKDTITSMSQTQTTSQPTSKKSVQLPRERVIDMSPEEQKLWEEEELSRSVNFARCHIDAAPFQLVAKTTLLKVHSLFSLLGITLAYVTATGKLIGVVAMKELRKAIEACNAGTFVPNEKRNDSDGTPDGTEAEVSEPLSPNDYEASVSSRDELEMNSTLDTEPELETDDENSTIRLD